MDAEAQAELIQQIAAEPIIQPGPRQSKNICGLTHTGWAVVNADGSCTCKPTTAPVLSIVARLRKLIYRLRYAFHLWRRVPWLTPLAALRYPVSIVCDGHDPIEDAETEIEYMAEG